MKTQVLKHFEQTDFVVQNSGDIVEREGVAGELRGTADWRGEEDGKSIEGRGVFGISEVDKLEAAAEIEKVKHHN